MKRNPIIKQPVAVIIATLVIVIITASFQLLSQPAALPSPADMPLGTIFDSLRIPPAALLSVTLLLALVNAVIINSIIVRYSICNYKSFLPLTLYIISAYSLSRPTLHLSIPLFQFSLLLSVLYAINSFRRSYQFQNVFSSAFFLGILPLMFADTIVLLPLLPIALFIYHRTMREVVTALFGVLSPWFLASTAWWIAGFGYDFIAQCLAENLQHAFAPETTAHFVAHLPLPNIIYAILFLAIYLFSAFVILRNFNASHNRQQKILTHFLWITVFGALLLFFDNAAVLSAAMFTISGTVILTCFFARFKGWLPMQLYVALVSLAIWGNLTAVL